MCCTLPVPSGYARHDQSGFGLVEVLMAIMLYGVALISLVGLLITSVTAGAVGESSGQAVNLARQRIETLTKMNIPELLAEDGAVSVERVPAGQGRPYTIATDVTDEGASVLITVTAQWAVGGVARPHTRTLRTRVAK